jgi:hypothetical protein
MSDSGKNIPAHKQGEKAFVREAVRCRNGCHVSIPRRYRGSKRKV